MVSGFYGHAGSKPDRPDAGSPDLEIDLAELGRRLADSGIIQ
jgi:hypothetical protein